MAADASAPRHRLLWGVLFPSLSPRTFPVSFRADATGGNLSALAFLWLGPSCSCRLGTALRLSASWDLAVVLVVVVLVAVVVVLVAVVLLVLVVVLVGLLVRATKPHRPAHCGSMWQWQMCAELLRGNNWDYSETCMQFSEGWKCSL